MKKATIIAFISLFCAVNAYAGDSCRCGNTIIRTGSTKYQVITHCGQPVAQDIIGYTEGNRNMKIEEIVYKMSNGYDYYFKLVGNRVTKIEKIRR